MAEIGRHNEKLFQTEKGEGVHKSSMVALLEKSNVNVTCAFLQWCFKELAAPLHIHAAPASNTSMAFLPLNNTLMTAQSGCRLILDSELSLR